MGRRSERVWRVSKVGRGKLNLITDREASEIVDVYPGAIRKWGRIGKINRHRAESKDTGRMSWHYEKSQIEEMKEKKKGQWRGCEDELEESIRKDYDKGVSQRELAKKLNMGTTTLRRWMKLFGIKFHTRSEASYLANSKISIAAKLAGYYGIDKEEMAQNIDFNKALKWVDSLVGLPTEEECCIICTRHFNMQDLICLIETRNERGLEPLEHNGKRITMITNHSYLRSA